MYSLSSCLHWFRQPAAKVMSSRTRANLAARVLLALAGGYVLMSLWAAWLSVTLPLPRHEAVMIASISSFMVFPVYASWVFYSASLKRIGVLTAMVMLLMALLTWIGKTQLGAML